MIIKFDDAEIGEFEFNKYKNPILINDIDINKIVVSNKEIQIYSDEKGSCNEDLDEENVDDSDDSDEEKNYIIWQKIQNKEKWMYKSWGYNV